MTIRTSAIMLLIIITSCSYNQAQQPDNKKPMYGEVAKTEEYKKLDEEFISLVIASNGGSREKGSESFSKKAWAYLYHDSLDLAMKRFNQAWLLNPENPDPYFGFGAILDLKNDSAQAERFYGIGVGKDNENIRIEACYQKVADCTEHLNDIKGTIKAYEKIVALNPKNAFGHKKLGYFYMEAKKYKKAISNYNSAIALDSSDAMTYNNRAYLYQTMKNYRLAIVDYTHAIKLNNKYISAFVNRGLTRLEAKEYEGAKKDFQTSITLDSKAGELWRFLGIAKMKLKDRKGACRDFEKSASLGDHEAVALKKANCK